MSVINPANNVDFKPTDALFARVRRKLRSFDAAGILDEGDWYQYVKEILDTLGVGVYDEREAVLMVKNFKAPLPIDFSYLYAAYKCSPTMSSNSKQTIFPQTGYVFYLEETSEDYIQQKDCYSAQKEYIEGSKITIRTYIDAKNITIDLANPSLLELAGNVKGICDTKCANLSVKSPSRISIDKNFVYTNFDEDSVYMKYYAFAIDRETGLPLIPDVSVVEKAIEDYIVYCVFNDFVINGEIPDIERKYMLVKANHEESYANARSYVKMPSFQTAINKIRRDRKNLGFYQM